MNIWHTFYFKPGALAEESGRSLAWQRGRHLVAGLGHCNACHRAHTTLGAKNDSTDAAGSTVDDWYAPPLADPRQADLQY